MAGEFDCLGPAAISLTGRAGTYVRSQPAAASAWLNTPPVRPETTTMQRPGNFLTG